MQRRRSGSIVTCFRKPLQFLMILHRRLNLIKRTKSCTTHSLPAKTSMRKSFETHQRTIRDIWILQWTFKDWDRTGYHKKVNIETQVAFFFFWFLLHLTIPWKNVGRCVQLIESLLWWPINWTLSLSSHFWALWKYATDSSVEKICFDSIMYFVCSAELYILIPRIRDSSSSYCCSVTK